MALRVTERAGLSDVGRQREANEDSYVVAEPLFAVADGMGGARAGEVASQMAAEILGAGQAGRGTPEERLRLMLSEANRRIYELAQSDDSRRGMGTTTTAAIVEDGSVSIGHVGDSRAYRLRDGVLEQLTHDHSLVAELERSGQLTAEAAEHHPQRSIITRALGPEPEVRVDTHTHAGRPGDVYLLCSDGLTGMVPDDHLGAILRGAGSLEAAADALVQAANQSGGKDNITVVLFRVEDDGAPAEEPGTLSGGDTIHQGLSAGDVQQAVREQERSGAAAPAPAAPAAARRAPAAGAPRRRSRLRRAAGPLVALLVLCVVGVGLLVGARQVNFVGTNDAGLVTLYRGVPYDLPFGVKLYSERHVSTVPVRSLPRVRRQRLLDHEWRSRSDAEDLVRRLERGELDTGRRAQ